MRRSYQSEVASPGLGGLEDNVAEMPGPVPFPPLDTENLRLAVGLMDVALQLSRFTLRPGVRKFRSAEEADAHRRAREEAETRRLRGAASP